MREYIVKEYELEDYDNQEETVENMSRNELADNVREIARGWLPDYNFTGDESDFDNHKLHMIMDRVAEILNES